MEKFWAAYDPESSSIWTMTYDEPEYNENLEDTIAIVTKMLAQESMSSFGPNCFAVIHTTESLEIQGVWVFNGPDPEGLFGCNEDTSWFSWSQLGPAPTDPVKKAVETLLAPPDNKLNGKEIKNTTVF